jgi:hypothetical protein
VAFGAAAEGVLRTRPIGVALTAGPLLACALGPSSTALGIAIGVAACVLLLALFFAFGTVGSRSAISCRELPAGSAHQVRASTGAAHDTKRSEDVRHVAHTTF